MSGPPPIPDTLPKEAKRRIEALDSRACPKCGGKAEWQPRKQALVCPYCNNILHAKNAAADETEIIREHDLRETLKTIEEASGGYEKGQHKIHCQHCNADSLVSSERVADRCQFCGSPEIITYDSIGSVIRPESLLPKQIDKTRAYEILKAWVGKRFWAPGDLKKKNLLEEMKGLYIPYWTFDAFSQCPWSADSGTYYWEKQRDHEGRTHRVRKTRWRHASGEIRFQFDDILVSATGTIQAGRLKAIEPFPTKDLIPYDTLYVSGWTVEHYQLTLLEGAKQSRSMMQAVLRNICARDVPGDTYRNLDIDPDYSNETFKHILVPVWMLVYQYRGKMFQTLVNGYTGKIDGSYPKSGWKIFFAVLIGIILTLVAGFLLYQK